ncbi:MAG: globin [Novosphingobium sp.]
MDAASLSHHDSMARSLDIIGEAGIDIVPLYFERFFSEFPEELAQFHNRQSSQGTMITQMITMLLGQAADEGWVPPMMCAQVTAHYDRGDIALASYRRSLDLLVEVLAEAAGPQWDAPQDTAWRTEAERLFAVIARYH